MDEIKKEDLIELLMFMEEQGLLTNEDKEEIFIKKNVERLKSLAYICKVHIENVLLNDEISKFKEGRLKKVLDSLVKSDTAPKLSSGKSDLIGEGGESLEKIVGD